MKTKTIRLGSDYRVAGNTNPDVKRLHGWRGTTNGTSCYAYGLREIIKIRQLKNGQVAVTVGPDLYPESA